MDSERVGDGDGGDDSHGRALRAERFRVSEDDPVVSEGAVVTTTAAKSADELRDDDRRGEERAPIELKVEYKRLNTFFYDYTKNISKGGTFIKTDRPLEIGTMFLFRLLVPVAADPIELRGEVRWVVRPGEPPPLSVPAGHETGMGIRFVYDSPTQRRSIERGVEKMMVDSLGQLIYSRLVHGDDDGAGGP